ncbi:hypothetical protein Y032_0071g502 [Ancylostoma ceylanicum]|uniref:Uncharacterized protein n=1 Tax=Ancylostoma ceylanicum TaxID=53326 RepID=A0A016TWM9_9BILA|nr:hypothetical protein Y032_0071g502 [Ancylostoma ceylanicum]
MRTTLIEMTLIRFFSVFKPGMSGLSVSGCPFNRYPGVFPYPLSAPLSGHLTPDNGADKAQMGRFNCA